jgi:hypothetical protein
LAEEQRTLVDIALQTLAAIRTGNVGASGATGGALTKTLKELRYIIETTLPEIRLMSPRQSAAKPAFKFVRRVYLKGFRRPR